LRNRYKVNRQKKWIFAIVILMITNVLFSGGCGRILGHEHTRDGVFEVARESTADTETVKDDIVSEEESDIESDINSNDTLSDIYVHVCGEVKNPGLYSFKAGQRINDAVEAAGGFTDKADRDAVNLASLLEDGQQIRIPDKSGASGRADTPSGVSDASVNGEMMKAGGTVNINTASADELASLSGIGQSKAAAILSYRQEHGSFARKEDIKQVPGIGEGTYKRIKDSISV
jgi:competence protein ComEA